MSILQKFRDSSRELSNVRTLTVCAMMLALRVVLGILANSLLPVLLNVKIGLNLIPVAIVAILYGPVCAAIVSGAGDILSILLNNATGQAINPGITLCCVLEGLILGLFLYHTERKLFKVIIAKVTLLLTVSIPLYTLVLYLYYHIEFLQVLIYRTAVLVPLSVLEVIIIFYAWGLLNKHRMKH